MANSVISTIPVKIIVFTTSLEIICRFPETEKQTGRGVRLASHPRSIKMLKKVVILHCELELTDMLPSET
jgi:hypothetical protein